MEIAGKITDVPGILVGHWTDEKARTGCTAILLPPGAKGGINVAGSAPATRDTLVLDTRSWIDEVHALVFTGGSAYGLDSAGGVMRYLERKKIGHVTTAGIVPIVPAAAIYDLNRGDPSARPGVEEGRLAARGAEEDFKAGSVGAGTGATCGKWMGIENAIPSGIGTASIAFGPVIVGAVAVVNPVGDIVSDNGRVLLGHNAKDILDIKSGNMSTVLVAVATNFGLDKLQCIQASSRIHDGIARSVYPSHTKHDGDAGFFFSCGSTEIDNKDSALDLIFKLTADVTALAIRSVASG